MRAGVITGFGNAPCAADVNEPQGDGILGSVLAATITPVDHLVASGRFPGHVALPFVSGKEGVAEITEAGTRFGRGSRVYFEFLPTSGGAFAERVRLSERDFMVEIPAAIDARQAAALGGSTGITAWMALDWTAQLHAGESVLVLGATGPTGFAAIAIAKILGASRVVAAGRNAAALARCREAGADAVVDIGAEHERLADAFREATGGGPDVIFDPISGPAARQALIAAKPGARLVTIGNVSGEELALPANIFIAKSLRVLAYANFTAPADLRAACYRKILENIASGRLRVPVETRSLEDVAAAWASTKASSYARYVLEPAAHE